MYYEVSDAHIYHLFTILDTYNACKECQLLFILQLSELELLVFLVPVISRLNWR